MPSRPSHRPIPRKASSFMATKSSISFDRNVAFTVSVEVDDIPSAQNSLQTYFISHTPSLDTVCGEHQGFAAISTAQILTEHRSLQAKQAKSQPSATYSRCRCFPSASSKNRQSTIHRVQDGLCVMQKKTRSRRPDADGEKAFKPSEIIPWGSSVRGRTVASLLRRPVLADRCRSQQCCLLTKRVQLHGFPNAQELPVRLGRYGLCGYRHILRGPDRDAPSFASLWFSSTAR